jgi:hypothetical protein
VDDCGGRFALGGGATILGWRTEGSPDSPSFSGFSAPKTFFQKLTPFPPFSSKIEAPWGRICPHCYHTADCLVKGD